MKIKVILSLLLTIFLFTGSFAQGVDNYSKEFTKYDLYKWRSQMEFKAKFFDTKTLDDFILNMEQFALDQWHVELVVTYEQYQKGDDSMMFTFKKQLQEYYGNISDDKFKKWYIPYYVFLQLDKWAEGYIRKQKG